MRTDGFHHEALLYGSEAEFLEGTVPFVEAAVAQGAATLVVVPADKIARLRSALGADADAVEFADMATVGRNPARIIPAWQAFVERQGGTGPPPRGVGEPMWPGRGPHELVECRHHEALLNVAFDSGPPFWLLCLYDTARLDPRLLEDAYGTHPFVSAHGDRRSSPSFHGPQMQHLLAEPLPPPPSDSARLTFTDLSSVRRFVTARARGGGLSGAVVTDVVLAVDEIASNSLRYGGGQGRLAIWREGDTFLCQVEDRGHIADPLVGRRRPDTAQSGRRGLWITNQLCQLVQIRTSPGGTTVRLHLDGRR